MIDNKRIAKNTIFLYFRMVLTMGVALYTSRVVLGVLGASDYGLYNVVGGVVSMFAFLNGVLSSGTSRFITYELGKGNHERLRDIFNIALVSHICLALIVFLLSETIGLWFVNTQLVFPPERVVAVNVVYQLSVLTLMLQFTQIPYTATIIAHEKLNIYAYISLLDVALKLLMTLLLSMINGVDNLVFYAIMIFCIQLCGLSIYRLYCYRKYPESKWRLCKEWPRYKEILSYSGWDVIGNLSAVTQSQGVNILLNVFFGPVVNAARAICYQVEGAFSQLTGNFMTAMNPQIVKSYAQEEYKDMFNLIQDGSKYGFYLLAIFLFPIMFKMDYVLNLWLEDVPDHTSLFVMIILSNTMVRTISRPILMGVHATGHIKRLDLFSGVIGLMALPVIYVLFKMGYESQFAFWTILIFGVIANIAEMIVFKWEMPIFDIKDYVCSVYGRCFLVAAIVIALNSCIDNLFNDTFVSFVTYFLVCAALNSCLVLVLGFDREKRSRIIIAVRSKLHL